MLDKTFFSLENATWAIQAMGGYIADRGVDIATTAMFSTAIATHRQH